MEGALFVFWSIWLFLIFTAAVRVFAYLVARRAQDKRWRGVKTDTSSQKSAVVIVPVKGFDLHSTPQFFNSLFSQNYSSYRVIVAFESWSDPVAQWLCEELEVSASSPRWVHPDEDSPLREVILTSGGEAEGEGQKVCNQRAAFACLEDEDEIISFADADISLNQDWLASLNAPINFGSHRLSTTYRWLIPKRPTLASQLASVINGSITTQGGWEMSNVLWGGSMAIHRDVFRELDLPELIKGSLNDDLRISKAARKAGNRIAFVRSLILPTMVDFDGRSFLEFARRQYTQVKFFSPILYGGTNLLLALYVLGFFSIVVALVYEVFHAWIPLAAAYVIDQFRGLARQQVYLSLFPQNGIRKKLSATCWLEQMLTPFWMVLHWLIVVSTWTQNKITWGGIRYKILSKSKTEIVSRSTDHEPLPVGVPGLAMIAALHDRHRPVYTPPVRPLETAIAPQEPAVAASRKSEPIAPAEPFLRDPILSREPAPKLSHPGVSPHVTPLRQLAIFCKTEPRARSSTPLPVFRAGVPLRGIDTRTRVLPSKRYPVPSVSYVVDSSAAAESSAPAPIARHPVRSPLRRALTAAETRIASQTGPGLCLAGLSAGTARGEILIHGMSRIALALSKSADIPRVHFPTRPSLASSSRPTGAARPPSTATASSPKTTEKPTRVIPATSRDLLPGTAALRPLRKGKQRVGNRPSVRTAMSGRTNLASSRKRGPGRNRPVSRGASGRSR